MQEKLAFTSGDDSKNFAHKIGELSFRLRCDFGIIHGAATFFLFVCSSRYSAEKRRAVAALFAIHPSPTQKMGKLQVQQTLRTFTVDVERRFVI